MATRLDLTSLPEGSYWRMGIADLIATEKDLCVRAMLDLINERSLKLELRIEDAPIEPMVFLQHFQEWSAAYTLVHLHRVLDPILDKLEGDDAPPGAEELAALARWLRSALASPGLEQTDG